MSSGIVIGLTGLAGSGKSTLAEYLEQEHGFTRLSFAGPLKKMLRTLDPWLDETPDPHYSAQSSIRLSEALNCFGQDELKLKESIWGGEYRRLLQVLGTDCIRAVDRDFWVRAALQEVTAEGNYVFDDIRFPNEALAVVSCTNGSVWNIPREGLVRGEHSSEQWAGKLSENFHLPNDGTEEELFEQAEHILNYLKGRQK